MHLRSRSRFRRLSPASASPVRPRASLRFPAPSLALLAALACAVPGVHGQSFPFLYWDTNGATTGIGGRGVGVNHTWNTIIANWSPVSIGNAVIAWSFNATPADTTAVFGGTPGDVVVSGNVTAKAISFLAGSTGYLLEGSGLLTLSDGTLDVGGTGEHRIATRISAARLYKTGTGTLVLESTTSSFGSSIAVQDGRLSVASDNHLGTNASIGVSLNGGILLARDTFTLASTHPVTSAGGGIEVAAGKTLTFAGTLNGAFTKSGPGTFVYSGSNTFHTDTPTVIAAGTLQIGNNGGTGNLSNDLSIASGATLEFARSNSFSVGSIISGAGTVKKSGAGTLTLTGDNSWTGPTRVSAGTLRLGSTGANLSDSMAVTVDGGATFALGSADETIGSLVGSGTVDLGARTLTLGGDGPSVTFSGAFAATAGGLVKTGADTFILADAPAYAGPTTVSAGTLQIGDGGVESAPAGDIAVASGATLAFLNTGSAAYRGVLSGAGLVTITGDLTLAAPQTHTGILRVLGGTLQVGDGGATGSLSSQTVELTGDLRFNRSANLTFTNTLGGAGTLYKSGSGDLVLSADTSAFTGRTWIDGGALLIDSDARLGPAPAALVQNQLVLDGGTLRTTATITLATNRGITLGEGGGTLSPDADTILTLGGVISGDGDLVKTGPGQLTLSGGNTHRGTTTASAGILRVAHPTALGGGLTLNGGSVQLAANSATDFASDTTLASSSTLTIDRSNSGAALTHRLGALTASAATLSLARGSRLTGTAMAGLAFDSTTLTGNTTFNVAANTRLVLGAMSDSGAARTLTKTGVGELEIGASNAPSGWTAPGGALIINQGIVRNKGANILGAGSDTSLTLSPASGNTATFDVNGWSATVGAVTFGGGGAGSIATGAGTLRIGGNVTLNASASPAQASISGKLDLGSATRTFNIGDSASAATDFLLSAIVSGDSGAGLTKTGAGTLRLSGANTYSGPTTVSGGFVEFTSLVNFGSGAITVNGGGLRWTPGSTADPSGRLVPIGSAGATFDTNGNDITFASDLTGTGTLKKSGAGTLTLTGTVAPAKGISISAGTLQIGDGGITGSVSGPISIATGAALTINRSDSFPFSSPLSGGGSLRIATQGTVTLSGAHTHTGGTRLSTGTLQLDSSLTGGKGIDGTSGDDRNGTTGGTALNASDGTAVLLGTAGRITGGLGGAGGAAGSRDYIIPSGGPGGAGLAIGAAGRITNAGVITGGKGGDAPDLNGGKGGDAVALGAGSTLINSGTLIGGAGGASDDSPMRDGAAGGSGLSTGTASLVTNTGTITGGQGGASGISTQPGGLGGVAVVLGADSTLVNSGTLRGGTSWKGIQAGAVVFSGANSTLELRAGYQIVGTVLANGTSRLVLGGASDASFNASQLGGSGGTYRSFGALVKDGASTWTITGTSPFVHPTTIAAGTLHLTGSLTGSAVTVASGGALSGTGSLTRPLTVQAGGLLSPGASPGLLTIGSGSILNGTTLMEIGGLDRGTGYDALDVGAGGTGNILLGGTLDVVFWGGWTPTGPASFQLIKAASFGGSFAQLNLPSASGYAWNTSRLHTEGILDLAAIPEPAAFATLAGLGALASAFGRRSRKRPPQRVSE